MYDDELIGVEDIQELELELLQRKRRQTNRRTDSGTESNAASRLGREPEDEIILESAVIVKTDAGLSSAASEIKPAITARPGPADDSDSDSTPDAEPAAVPDSSSGLQTTAAPDSSSGSQTTAAPDSSANSQPAAGQSSRYSILSGKLMDERRYIALMKSIEDLQYREQLYNEYGIAPLDAR